MNLHSLSLTCTGVTDEGAKVLKGLAILRTLYAGGTKLTDAGLRELPAGLEKLDLGETRITSVKELHRLTNLHTLDPSDRNGTPAVIREMKGMKALHTLGLGTGITDETLAALRECRLLHVLNRAAGQDGTRPTEPDEVAGLYLPFSQVSDAGLEELKGLKNLKSLDLTRTRGRGISRRRCRGSPLPWAGGASDGRINHRYHEARQARLRPPAPPRPGHARRHRGAVMQQLPFDVTRTTSCVSGGTAGSTTHRLANPGLAQQPLGRQDGRQRGRVSPYAARSGVKNGLPCRWRIS